jgi:hypothetical protein
MAFMVETCKKGKVVHVLNYSTKTYGGSGCMDPFFLTSALVGGEWSSFRPLPLYPRRKSPRKLGVPQSQPLGRMEEKILDPTGTRTLTSRPFSP